MQNQEGGVAVSIRKLYNSLKSMNIEVDYFSFSETKIENYDIVHIYKITVDSLQIIEYAKRHNVKVVVSSVIARNEALKVKVNCFICKLLPITTGIVMIKRGLTLSDIIVTETQKEKEYITKNYGIPSKKIVVVSNSIDLDCNIKNADEIYNYLHFKKYILCVGRFDKNKNQFNLIKAVNSLNYPLVLIGEGVSKNDEYFKKCKEEAKDNVIFLGWVPHNSSLLKSAYFNAHVVVCPSYDETFGLSIIEGCIFNSNVSFSKTIKFDDNYIMKNAVLFNPKSVTSIKKALKEVFEDKIVSFDKNLKEYYSLDTYLKRIIDVYKKVLN